MNYLLLKADGKLYCAFIEDEQKSFGFGNVRRKTEYEQAKAEAIANALEVVNPELAMMRGHFVGVDTTTHTTKYTKMEVGELYPWNGGAEVEEVFAPENICKDSPCDEMCAARGCVKARKKVVSLSLPECEKPITAEDIIYKGHDPLDPNERLPESDSVAFKKITADRQETQEQLWDDVKDRIVNEFMTIKELMERFTLTRR